MTRHLRMIDLNLLVALDALLTERQVTRAANRVGMSQPAMSNALARLRELFGDPILVRTSRGMEPTSRGLQIADATAQILRQVERVFEDGQDFDPATAERRFALRMSDLLEALLLPRLLNLLERSAPRCSMEILHLPPEQTVQALEENTIDAAVSTGLRTPATILSSVLFEDRMVCVMRRGHRALSRKWSLETFLALRHVRVSISPTDTRFVDSGLTALKRTRDVALNTPHWLMLPAVLIQSDLVSVMSERLAKSFANVYPLAARPLPFKADPIRWTLYWHQRNQSSRAHIALRDMLAGSAAPFARRRASH